jgi:serine/threonine protein kinase
MGVSVFNELLEGEFPDIEVFELLARLGAGGFGDVYVSRRRRPPEQLAAVKILKYSLDDDPDSSTRFLTEIDSIRKAKSAFMPEYLEFGSTGLSKVPQGDFPG